MTDIALVEIHVKVVIIYLVLYKPKCVQHFLNPIMVAKPVYKAQTHFEELSLY